MTSSSGGSLRDHRLRWQHPAEDPSALTKLTQSDLQYQHQHQQRCKLLQDTASRVKSAWSLETEIHNYNFRCHQFPQMWHHNKSQFQCISPGKPQHFTKYVPRDLNELHTSSKKISLMVRDWISD